MTLTIPPWLEWLEWVAGSDWPHGDEDAMWEMARELQAIADDVDRQVPNLTAALNRIVDAYPEGDGREKMEKALNALTSGEGSVSEMAKFYGDLSQGAKSMGTELQYAKLMVIGSLVWLAAEIAAALIFPPTAPAVQAAATATTQLGMRILGRQVMMKIIQYGGRLAGSKLANFWARDVIIDTIAETALDWGIQAYQVDQGSRDKINWEQVGTTFAGSLAGELAGNVVGAKLAGKLGPGFFRGAVAGAGAGLVGAGAGFAAGTATQFGINLYKEGGDWGRAWDKTSVEFDPRMITGGVISGAAPMAIRGGWHARGFDGNINFRQAMADAGVDVGGTSGSETGGGSSGPGSGTPSGNGPDGSPPGTSPAGHVGGDSDSPDTSGQSAAVSDGTNGQSETTGGPSNSNVRQTDSADGQSDGSSGYADHTNGQNGHSTQSGNQTSDAGTNASGSNDAGSHSNNTSSETRAGVPDQTNAVDDRSAHTDHDTSAGRDANVLAGQQDSAPTSAAFDGSDTASIADRGGSVPVHPAGVADPTGSMAASPVAGPVASSAPVAAAPTGSAPVGNAPAGSAPVGAPPVSATPGSMQTTAGEVRANAPTTPGESRSDGTAPGQRSRIPAEPVAPHGHSEAKPTLPEDRPALSRPAPPESRAGLAGPSTHPAHEGELRAGRTDGPPPSRNSRSDIEIDDALFVPSVPLDVPGRELVGSGASAGNRGTAGDAGDFRGDARTDPTDLTDADLRREIDDNERLILPEGASWDRDRRQVVLSDGTRVEIRVGEVDGRPVAEFAERPDGSGYDVTVSPRARDQDVARAVAHELAEIDLAQDPSVVRDSVNDRPSQLTTHLGGRFAELRVLISQIDQAISDPARANELPRLHKDLANLLDRLGLRDGPAQNQRGDQVDPWSLLAAHDPALAQRVAERGPPAREAALNAARAEHGPDALWDSFGGRPEMIPQTNPEIRQWYNDVTGRIPDLVDQWTSDGVPLEEQARRASEIRHNARVLAREMMTDPAEVELLRARDMAKYQNPDGPTFEWLIGKAHSEAHFGDDAYRHIIGSSNRTDAETNRRLLGTDRPAPADPDGHRGTAGNVGDFRGDARGNPDDHTGRDADPEQVPPIDADQRLARFADLRDLAGQMDQASADPSRAAELPRLRADLANLRTELGLWGGPDHPPTGTDPDAPWQLLTDHDPVLADWVNNAVNAEVRQWYNDQTSGIPALNERLAVEGVPVEERARRASEIRHHARLAARDMMPNRTQVDELRARDQQKYGNPDGPTFRDLVEKARSRGLSGDDIYHDIIGSSNRTNEEYNRRLLGEARPAPRENPPPDDFGDHRGHAGNVGEFRGDAMRELAETDPTARLTDENLLAEVADSLGLITPDGVRWNSQRHHFVLPDGSTVSIRVGEVADGNVAEFVQRTDGGCDVTVSEYARRHDVARAVAHELAEIYLSRDPSVLRDPVNDRPSVLTTHLGGRFAELRVLAAHIDRAMTDPAHASELPGLHKDLADLLDRLGVRDDPSGTLLADTDPALAQRIGELGPPARAAALAAERAEHDADAAWAGLGGRPEVLPRTNAEIRQWYNDATGRIPDLLDQWAAAGVPLEEQARRASEIRHNARMAAREMMSDPAEVELLRARDAEKYGNPDGPTVEWLIGKSHSTGHFGDDAHRDIIGSSNRTDAETNRRFTVDPRTGQTDTGDHRGTASEAGGFHGDARPADLGDLSRTDLIRELDDNLALILPEGVTWDRDRQQFVWSDGRRTLTISIDVGPVRDGAVAEFAGHRTGYDVTVSHRARDRDVVRAVAHELAEIVLAQDPAIDRDAVDDRPSVLTAHLGGRFAELRVLTAQLDRAAADPAGAHELPGLQRDLAELGAVLGLRNQPAAAQRWALLSGHHPELAQQVAAELGAGPPPAHAAAADPVRAPTDLEFDGAYAEDAVRRRGPDATAQDLLPPRNPTGDVAAARARATANARWWQRLGTTRQEAMIRMYPTEVGNAEGLPAAARDAANRLALDRDLAGFRARRPERLGSGQLVNPEFGAGEPQRLRSILDARNALSRAEQLVLAMHPDAPRAEVQLLSYGRGELEIGIGDADTATSVSRHVLHGTDLRTLRDDMVFARNHYEATARQNPETSVASIVSRRYDLPGTDTVRARSAGYALAERIAAFNAGRDQLARLPDGAAPARNHLFGYGRAAATVHAAAAGRRLRGEIGTLTMSDPRGVRPRNRSEYGLGDHARVVDSSGRRSAMPGRLVLEPVSRSRTSVLARYLSADADTRTPSPALELFGRIAAGRDDIELPGQRPPAVGDGSTAHRAADAEPGETTRRPRHLGSSLPEDAPRTRDERRFAQRATEKLKQFWGPAADRLSLVQPVPPSAVVDAARTRATTNARWWHSLSDDEQSAMVRVHPHLIGNTDGIPYTVRDIANRLSITRDLAGYLARRPAGSGLRWMTSVLTDSERGHLSNLVRTRDQLAAIERGANEMIGSPDVQLLAYDAHAYDGNGRVSVAIGNADTASVVSRHIGGYGTTLQSLHYRSAFARAQFEVSAQLARGDTLAAIIDIGYHHPTRPAEAANPIYAEVGGYVVARDIVSYNATREFQAQHPAGSDRPLIAEVPRLITAIGHGYGSATLCHAGVDGRLGAREAGGRGEIDQVVLSGSPGAGPLTHAREFGIGDNVYVLTAHRDPIAILGADTPGRLGRFFNRGLGADPSNADWGATRCAAEPPRTSEFRGGMRIHQGYNSFADAETRQPTEALRNIALINAGRAAEATLAEHRAPADEPTMRRRIASLPTDPERARVTAERPGFWVPRVVSARDAAASFAAVDDGSDSPHRPADPDEVRLGESARDRDYRRDLGRVLPAATPPTPDEIATARGAFDDSGPIRSADDLRHADYADDEVVAGAEQRSADNFRWWHSLDAEQRAALIRVHPHQIGNADGIPFAVRDEANRLSIARDLAAFRARCPAGADIAQWMKQLDSAERLELENLLYTHRALVRAMHQAASMEPAVPAPPVQVMSYDATEFGGEGRAVVAFGDADTAEIALWQIPGITTTLQRLSGRLTNSWNLYEVAARLNPNLKLLSIAWIGYDAPSGGAMMTQTVSPAPAIAGGRLLARDVVGYLATRRLQADLPGWAAPPQWNRIYAHSYGSTTAAYAANGGRFRGYVDTVVLLGSPGMGPLTHADEFGVGEVYVAAGSIDPVTHLGADIAGQAGRLAGRGQGIDPATWRFGAQRIPAEFPAVPRFSDGLRTHRQYWQFIDIALRIPTEPLGNFGLIAIGRGDLVMPAPLRPGTDEPTWLQRRVVARPNDPEANRTAAAEGAFDYRLPPVPAAAQPTSGPEVQGHRGGRGLWPENTLPAFRRAMELGVHAIELDVGLTRDGVPIVHHEQHIDPKTVRDTEPATADDAQFPYVGKPIRELGYEQVRTLDTAVVHQKFAATQTAEPGSGIASLAEVARLALETGWRGTLCVEIKTDPSWSDEQVRALVQATVDVLGPHDVPYRLLAFDWRVLGLARDITPHADRVALISPRTSTAEWMGSDGGVNRRSRLRSLAAQAIGASRSPGGDIAAAAHAAGATMLSPDVSMVTEALMRQALAAGLPVVPWTVNDPAAMNRLIELGVAGIVTDFPDRLRAIVAEHGFALPDAVARSPEGHRGTAGAVPRTIIELLGPPIAPAATPLRWYNDEGGIPPGTGERRW